MKNDWKIEATEETQIRSRFTLAHRKLLLHNRNELVGYTDILVGFLSYILYILIFYILSLSRDKEYSFETRRNSLRDRRSRKICPNPTKVGIYSVQRSLYLLYLLRRPCNHFQRFKKTQSPFTFLAPIKREIVHVNIRTFELDFKQWQCSFTSAMTILARTFIWSMRG